MNPACFYAAILELKSFYADSLNFSSRDSKYTLTIVPASINWQCPLGSSGEKRCHNRLAMSAKSVSGAGSGVCAEDLPSGLNCFRSLSLILST